MRERFKILEKYPDYKISNKGRIFSIRRNIFLKQSLLLGYKIITIYGKNTRVHRLVAETFIKNKFNKPHVNHLDGNKANNYYKNLEWCTSSENEYHSYKNGMKSRVGEKHNNAKLNNKKIIEIRNSKKDVYSLADKYKVSISAIYKVKSKLRWSHL